MVEEHTLELIHLAIDGEATTAEQVDLQQRLGSSRETQAAFDELRHLVGEIESLPYPPVPSGFKQTVLDALRGRQARSSRVIPFPPRRKAFAAVYAVAAAVILGILLYPVVFNQPRPPVNGLDAAGSMARIEIDQWPEIASLRTPDQKAALSIRENAGQLAIVVQGVDPQPVSVSWNLPALPVVSTSPASPVRNGAVTFPATGQGRSVVVLRTAGARADSLSVFVSAGGKELLSTSVPLN